MPRYFGDYPAGSGYVLFYQAVDLDLESMGLEKPKPKTPESNPMPASMPIPTSGLRSPGMVSPGIELLDEEVSRDKESRNGLLSPKMKVQTALTDYQARVAQGDARATPTSPSTRSTGLSESYDSSIFGSSSAGFTPALAAEPATFERRSIPSSPTTSTPVYEIPTATTQRTERAKDATMSNPPSRKSTLDVQRPEAKSKRSSFFGAFSPKPVPTRAESFGSSMGLPPTLDKLPTGVQKLPPDRGLPSPTPSRISGLPFSGSVPLPTPPKSIPPSEARSTPLHMSGSMMSTGSGESSGATGLPVSSSLLSPNSYSNPATIAGNVNRRPSSSSSSTFSGLLKRSAPSSTAVVEDGDNKGQNRIPSTGSLSRRLSTAGRVGLTRSTSSAFGKLGFGKKDKEKDKFKMVDEGQSLMEHD